MSGIVREPLNGERALLPVGDDYTHWYASPRAAAGFARHALTVDTSPLGHRRTMTMPGVALSIEEIIEALRDVGGQAAVDLIDRAEDPDVHALVTRWPRAFDTARANALGFRAESSARALVDVYLDVIGRA
jgi:nucleoside-diphosphate-sugar epimerase